VAIAAADFLFMRMEVERKYGAVALRKTDTRYYSTALCFILYLAYLKLIATPPRVQCVSRGRNLPCSIVHAGAEEIYHCMV